MKKPTLEDEVAALKDAVIILVKATRDALARAEALRVLLARADVISQADYERLRREAIGEFDRLISRLLTEKHRAATDKALRRLLENYEGTKQ